MKAKLIIENKEIEIEISEEEYKKLQPSEEKKTGYERVSKSDIYFYTYPSGCVETTCEACYDIDDKCYESANYYSDKTVAENNARADKLMRQLRRFSVEHRECGVDFNSTETAKHYIYYDCVRDELRTTYTFYAGVFGVIYFDSEETAQAAIDEFHDELIWYFTEYKDSL
jgi:hypothetical protein